jgi:hypothetical protein
VRGFVIQAQVLGVLRKFAPAIVGFRQAARLDHRAHGAVEQQDALPYQPDQFHANLFAVIHRFRSTPSACDRNLCMIDENEEGFLVRRGGLGMTAKAWAPGGAFVPRCCGVREPKPARVARLRLDDEVN